MKVLFFHSGAHRKNTKGIQLMCQSHSLDLEFTESFERCKHFDYDILISNNHYFDISFIPEHIKVIFGPQLWVFAEGDIVGPLDSKLQSRAVFNALSDWNIIRLLEDKPLKVPCVSFPFAVDIDKFKPDQKDQYTLDCLLYYKSRHPDIATNVEAFLNEKNIKYRKIVYGTYNEEEYKRLLQEVKFMIVIDSTESQGFALEEAMACNVPLLVWDATSMHDEYVNGRYTYSSNTLPLRGTSVPYWSSECGMKVYKFEEFVKAFEKMMHSHGEFNPRKFVEAELSPYNCMQRILSYFKT